MKFNFQLYSYMVLINVIIFISKFLVRLNGWDYELFITIVVGAALVYMLWYAISEGHWFDILIGTGVALAIAVLAPIHPIFTLIGAFVILGLVIKQSIRLIKLLPLALMGGIFFALLFNDYLLNEFLPSYAFKGSVANVGFNELYFFFFNRGWETTLDFCYLALAIIVPFNFAKGDSKRAFFNYCFFLILVPILTLIVSSIMQGVEDFLAAGKSINSTEDLAIDNLNESIQKELPKLPANPQLGVSGVSATALEEAADIAHEHIIDNT